MEKRTPHYKLADIKAIVASPARRPFTATALRGGLDLGLTEQEKSFYTDGRPPVIQFKAK